MQVRSAKLGDSIALPLRQPMMAEWQIFCILLATNFGPRDGVPDFWRESDMLGLRLPLATKREPNGRRVQYNE